jgi:hypothetical protein
MQLAACSTVRTVVALRSVSSSGRRGNRSSSCKIRHCDTFLYALYALVVVPYVSIRVRAGWCSSWLQLPAVFCLLPAALRLVPQTLLFLWCDRELWVFTHPAVANVPSSSRVACVACVVQYSSTTTVFVVGHVTLERVGWYRWRESRGMRHKQTEK